MAKLTFPLIPFSHHDKNGPVQGEVSLFRDEGLWLLDFQISFDNQGEMKLDWPLLTNEERIIGLWENTCLEAFFMFEDGTYEEWNFSPTGAWNCFSFTGYRTPQDLVEKPVEIPTIKNPQTGHLKVAIEARAQVIKANFSAVIKETSGQIHYLAVRHPKDKPDFHQKDCFSPLA